MPMKTKISTLLICGLITSYRAYSQVPTGTPPPAATTPASCPPIVNQSWFRGGNTLVTGGPNNIFGFAAGQNSNIWHRTNGFSRMLMEKGLGNQVDGRIAYGNALPNNFVPIDRVHLFETATTGSVQVRFQNTNTGVNTTDGYAIGVDNNNRVVNHTQFEKREMRWLSPNARNSNTITEWLRIDNNKTSVNVGGASTDGFIGLNEQNPFFHLEGNTPAIVGGELFVGFHPTDVANSRMGMVNAAAGDNVFLPTLFGNVDATQRF